MDQAVLMFAYQNLSDYEINDNIEELKNLAQACDIETMDVLHQNIRRKSNATYIGKGKLEELKVAVDAQEANLVVFNVGLSPSQIRNLEEVLNVDVVDKNMLVLEIFSLRAQTNEAKAQVEIAQLNYVFPRMIGSYEHLGRQVSGFGNRNRGLGETKLELDRREVSKRIKSLKNDLKLYQQTRKTTRDRKLKSNLPLVSLVGYTNAGKSSLMNYMIDDKERHVFVKDMLFASLETYSREIDLGNNHKYILNDTVGFIKELPHDLIPAFHASLEEIEDSDLLLHVVDISNPFYQEHIATIEDTLNDLEVGDIPIITVYNKIDLTSDLISHTSEDTSFISIVEDDGVKELIDLIETKLWSDEISMSFKFPYDKMNLVENILKQYSLIEQEHLEDGVLLKVMGHKNLIKQYEEYFILED